MRKVIKQNFFNRPTLKVAKELLGKFLVRKIGKEELAGKITEIEAYVGFKDKASHASHGRTERTKVMFGKPGQWYVYLIYGMHYCLNIVTEKEHFPAAVLIRAVDNTKGPGRVAKYFHIDKSLNNTPAGKRGGLWIEERGLNLKPSDIKREKRIGVEYAGKYKDKLWRFYLADK
ncbi:MAG: DNA-3-methyladenine glycosylase [bacterium]|nr:DNA-3-methyladenine glycosylase [bacterium]